MTAGRPEQLIRRTYPVKVEMGFVTLVLAVWQLLRIPFAGSVPEALRHAHSWLAAERAIGLDFEPTLIRAAHEHGPVLRRLVSLGYSNLHLIAIFAFLATARLILAVGMLVTFGSATLTGPVATALIIGFTVYSVDHFCGK